MAYLIGNLRCLFRRLFFRISFDIFLIIIIPTVFIIIALAYNLRENIRDVTLSKFEAELKDKAHLASANIDFIADDLSFIAKHLEQHFSGMGGEMNHIAYGVPPRQWYRADRFKNFMDDMETMLLMNNGFLKVRLINNSGREIVRFDRTATGIKEVPFEELEDKSGRDYFKNAMAYPAGMVYLHPITLEMDHGKIILPRTPVIRLSKKIMTDGGAMVGILVLTATPDAVFGPEYRGDRPGSVIIDETGAFLRHHDKRLVLAGESSRKANIFDEIPQLKTNLGLNDAKRIFDGAKGEYRVWRKVFYQEDDRERYWVLLERYPEFSIVSGYTDILVKYAGILAFVLIAGLLLVMATIFKSLLPIKDITEAMRKREAGDMDARAPATGVENEIGEIAGAFNAMADRMNQAALELQRSMALEQSISDIAPTAHIIADSGGVMLSVNPAATSMFGYSAGEMTGKNVTMLAPSFKEDEYSKYIQDYLDYKKTGLPEKRNTIRAPKEVVAVNKNGEIFYISLYVKEVPLAAEDVFVGILEDITERRANKRALMEEVENSKAIMNATTETLALIGLEGNVIAMNEAGAQRFKMHHTEIAGKSLYQILPLELAMKRMGYFEEAARTGTPVMYEDERDGRIFSSSVYPVIDKDAEVTRCAVFSTDISERRRQENELAEREIKLRAILDAAADAIILTNEKGIVELFNPAGARMFKWAAGDVIGKNVNILMPEPHQSQHDGYLERYIRSGEKITMGHMQEVPCLRSDGSRFSGELYVTELWLGKARKFLGVIRDVSERKLAEEALQKSTDNLAMAQRIAHLGSWELDLSTYTPSWSDETFRILGFEPGEIVPSFDAFMKTVHPDDRKAVKENLEVAMNGGELPAMEQRIVRKNGVERTVKVQGEVIRDEAGMPIKVGGTVLDITELKNLEKMRDDFFHAVVHDLKSPITGIKLELDMLADRIASFSAECSTKEPCRVTFSGYEDFLKRQIADIGEGIDQLYLMIQSLLKLGEIEEEKLELQYQAFGMNDLFRELEHDFRGRAAAKGLVMEFGNVFTGTVIADFKLLKRVLQNLIDNAVKYGTANTKIAVNAISGKKNGAENIIISVTNTGKPLTGAKINALFQKFKTHGHAESGSGIGLFFCHKTMDMLGGGIYVDQDASTITFHIFFPNG